MDFNKKTIIILLVIIAALLIVGAAAAKGDTGSKTKKVTVQIHNANCDDPEDPYVKFKNGDAVAGYVTYTGNMQFDKGTGVTAWYLGSGIDGDIEPHHTKFVKAKFFFKNKKGKVKTKTVKGTGAHISTKLIKGYTPYKATVWYKSY